MEKGEDDPSVQIRCKGWPNNQLSPYIQVLERLIHKQLASHFYECNLLCKSQSGFKRMHSTDGCNLFRRRDSHEYG